MSEKLPLLDQENYQRGHAQEGIQSTTDQPVASVEPSANPQDHVTSVPHVEKLPEIPKGAFKRQMVLLANVVKAQYECELGTGHVLNVTKDLVSCYNCGGLWIR